MNNDLIQPQDTEIIMYQTEDGLTKADVQMSGETVWLSLDQMADLFQRDKSTISRYIKNIFEEGELDRIRGTQWDCFCLPRIC